MAVSDEQLRGLKQLRDLLEQFGGTHPDEPVVHTFGVYESHPLVLLSRVDEYPFHLAGWVVVEKEYLLEVAPSRAHEAHPVRLVLGYRLLVPQDDPLREVLELDESDYARPDPRRTIRAAVGLLVDVEARFLVLHQHLIVDPSAQP